uniref:Uncharacterized protein n=1 Tax=Acrobeloides nanus TaxID=290746 RepID=A0A914DJI1_9BILA
MKVFVTVSYALLCYSIFYGVPTILQMLCYYFSITGWVKDTSTYFIVYGGEFHGILNASIYTFKHQEFRNYSKQLIYKVTGKMKPISSTNFNNTTQGKILLQRTNTAQTNSKIFIVRK